MPRDFRRADDGGNPIAFSCENSRFRTNLAKGETHGGQRRVRGSVFPGALIERGGFSLWLEHVEEIETSEEYYWLMWYDAQGRPTIPMSGVFDRSDLAGMLGQLGRFVP